MHRHEGNAKSVGKRCASFFVPELDDSAYITTECSKKHRNMVRKFPKNCTVKFVTTWCHHHGAHYKTFTWVHNYIRSGEHWHQKLV